MNNLKTGQFYGSTNETIRLKGVTLTDTEYTHEKVDWHFMKTPISLLYWKENFWKETKKNNMIAMQAVFYSITSRKLTII